MDIGLHILGSVTSNENGLPGQKELRGSKQDRSGFDGEDCFQRSLKLARTITTAEVEDKVEGEECFSSSSAYCKTMSFHQGIPVMRSASLLSSDSRRQEHMLSFSDKPEALDFSRYVGLDNTSNKNSPLSPFLSPSCFKSSGGYGYGGMMMNMSMQGNFTSVKGPFTLTQWAELEQQALIYKYIIANVPVPSSLIISIKKSFYPYGSSLPPTSPFGWGTFHLGLAGGNMDPEPGRCRRTDGKKWRCSRDAVPDQKYCERHINRGRHRSRKPVEVQSGQTAAATLSKAVTMLQQSAVAGGSNRSNARASSTNHTLATGGQCINPSTDSIHNNRVRNPQGVPVYPSTVNLQPKESPKHRNNNNPFEFGRISSDSLLNPNTIKSYGSSFLDFSSNQDKHPGNHNQDSWPEELKSDWTQLSMSIPISSSSTSSTHNTAQDKTVLSPLRLSRELEASYQTEETLEAAKKANTWIPISWGNNSLGGPLGEVLNNSTTNSPTLASSPTGVLQKSTFCSLSNSSSVSSPPIADRNNVDYFHYTI